MTKITKEIIDKKQISVQLLRIKNRNFLGATNVKVLLQCESISQTIEAYREKVSGGLQEIATKVDFGLTIDGPFIEC